MDKPKIRIADSVFAHGTSLGSGDLKIYPTYFDWYRGPDNINDLIILTDSHLHLVDNYSEKIKIAWLLEPPSISPHTYQYVRENATKFTHILTHQLSVLATVPNAISYVFGGCWILEQDRQIYPKTKNVSIIASAKTITPGHVLRHEVIADYAKAIQGIYGRGYQKVDYKLEALKDYRFSIVIENEQSDFWITEKLIDAIVCGCVPIYWGYRNLSKLGFDMNGIIQFDKKEELYRILPYCNDIHYGQIKHMGWLDKNFEVAKEFTIPEDGLWKHILRFYFF